MALTIAQGGACSVARFKGITATRSRSETVSQEVSAANVVESRPGAFVVPFYGDQELSVRYLAEAIDGFDRQSDPSWRAIIVDDATPRRAQTVHLTLRTRTTRRGRRVPS